MRISYDAPRLPTLAGRCELLEALAEAMVAAQIVEMAPDKDAYPCCVKCGELAFRAVPGMPGSHGPPSDVPLYEGQSQALARVLASGEMEARADAHGGPGGLRIQCARELSRSKVGHALELAIFQCAAERVRDKECKVVVRSNQFGNVHAYVAYPDGETKNPQDDTVSGTPCGCEAHG
jgi:hypothetical protein